MKKILGIFVMTLLIATTVLPSVSAPPTIDQSQERHDDDLFISDFEWQEFVPTMKMLKMVEVRVVQWFTGSPDLRLTVEKPLGSVLRTKEVPASLIKSPVSDWVIFDIPDIEVIPGETYYIRITAPLGSEYGWGAGNGDPYTNGMSSKHPIDFCFRTWASNGKSKTRESSSTIHSNDKIIEDETLMGNIVVVGIMESFATTMENRDYEVILFAIVIESGSLHKLNSGEMIRLYNFQSIEIGSIVIAFCDDWGIIG